MSFDMSNIKKRKIVTRQDFKEYYAVIYGRTNLTDNLKLALREYLRFRLFKRNIKFSIDELNNMIIELLETIIHKNIKDITQEDVIINENQLLYEIAKAIYNKSLHSLVYKLNSTNILQIKPILKKQQLNQSEVEDYFRSLMK